MYFYLDRLIQYRVEDHWCFSQHCLCLLYNSIQMHFLGSIFILQEYVSSSSHFLEFSRYWIIHEIHSTFLKVFSTSAFHGPHLVFVNNGNFSGTLNGKKKRLSITCNAQSIADCKWLQLPFLPSSGSFERAAFSNIKIDSQALVMYAPRYLLYVYNLVYIRHC